MNRYSKFCCLSSWSAHKMLLYMYFIACRMHMQKILCEENGHCFVSWVAIKKGTCTKQELHISPSWRTCSVADRCVLLSGPLPPMRSQEMCLAANCKNNVCNGKIKLADRPITTMRPTCLPIYLSIHLSIYLRNPLNNQLTKERTNEQPNKVTN